MKRLRNGLSFVGLAIGGLAIVERFSAAPVGAQTASASASAAPPPPALRGADIPVEVSKPPTAAEWKQGRPISIEGARENCSFRVLREYVRAACVGWVGVGLAAGEPEDVRVWVSGKWGWDDASQTSLQPTALADVPLRRGKSHIVSFNDIDWGYESGTFGDGGHLIVAWREGEAEPVIVMVKGGV